MIHLRFCLRASMRRFARRVSCSWVAAGLGLALAATPSTSAEKIIFSYGLFERSVVVDELEAFARGEGLSNQLTQYANNLGLTEAQLESLREVLTQRADLDEVDVAQFLYTAQGSTLLDFLGEVVQTSARQSGAKAIRGGLILAAADETDGLTVLNFLKKYPTPAVRVDIGRGFEFAGEITQTLGESERAIALVNALSEAAAQQPVERDAIVTARQLINDPAPFAVVEQPLNLPSSMIPFQRVRATLYLPQQTSPIQPLPDNIPVIVISHGLGDEQSSYEYLANYLARQGFVVATLDHPGSNSEQIENLLAGLSSDVVDDREFVARPRDVSTLLDELQAFANTSSTFRNRLDIQNVGVIGQSFGGYTALVLAGAQYDMPALQSACEPRPVFLNPSLLLQCQVATAEISLDGLKDDRVKAIVAVNPVGSEIFGEAGFAEIDVPVMMVAATADTVAPALPEQIRPFTWLQTESRYLALFSGTTHFSVIATNPNVAPSIPVPQALLGESPLLAQEYLEVLSIAFFQRHLRQDGRFETVLSPQYLAENLQDFPLEPLSLIRALTPEALERAIAD